MLTSGLQSCKEAHSHALNWLPVMVGCGVSPTALLGDDPPILGAHEPDASPAFASTQAIRLDEIFVWYYIWLC
jgi:hypothetical protein